MSSETLSKSIEFLKGVGPQKAEALNKDLQIFTVADLLSHYPYKYIDRTKIYKINEINPDSQYIQVKGKLSHFRLQGKFRSKRLTATLKDETGEIELVWFKGAQWIQKILKPGNEYIAFGKPNFYKGKINLPHPEMEFVDYNESKTLTKIQPLYNTSELMKKKSLDTKAFSKFTKTALEQLNAFDFPEFLPSSIINELKLISKYDAIKNIHYPENDSLLKQATNRLKFEELFIIQMNLLRLKVNRQIEVKGFVFDQLGKHFNYFYDNNLEFELTNAQKKVIKEIRADLNSGKQMNRLLQGDVGSGKTIVALMAMLIAIDNGFQASIMAPTEILAQQHFETITSLLKNMQLKVQLITGSTKDKDRKIILQLLEAGEIDILIGTHALIEPTVKFNNLGLVVIDEQHRFGVAQRAKLLKKNVQPPHMLIMTATPIPRTLAMTFYADLDTSIIDELPPGRKQVQTVHKYDSGRLRVFGFVKEEIKKGRQVYFVYPLIQESEKLDYKDLMDGYESITRYFKRPEYQVGILHGQMKPEDKAIEMERFVKGQTNILVSTTVIEVGVNVPNASVMVIESAERFGLSQLHQLRGRVGRGAEKSFCILMSGNKLSKEGRERLKTMVMTNDGFKIAEVDLKLRGPGNIEGLQQSGLAGLRIADLVQDNNILVKARELALKLLGDDPQLLSSENQKLKNYLDSQKGRKEGWSRVG